MSKDQLQKEILEKIKDGIKPSDLKKSKKPEKKEYSIPTAPLLTSTKEKTEKTVNIKEITEILEENKQILIKLSNLNLLYVWVKR